MLINGGKKMLEPIANNPEANYANVLDVRGASASYSFPMEWDISMTPRKWVLTMR